MKRALYTLSAAAALFGAVPVTAFAEPAEARSSPASCPCAAMNAGAAEARPNGSARSIDREEQFLREVWSAP